jgi:spore germination cell wall hydrolase CwlJ-like protein
MFHFSPFKRASVRRHSQWLRWWTELRFFWYASDKTPWFVGTSIGLIVAGFGALMISMVANDTEHRELNCLALNVYYEARGEPRSGRYAVAEVTMNRVASPRYPGTVCEVVYQKNWDPLRKRYVGAFSWTEFDVRPMPEGEPWKQAREAAAAVYNGAEPAQVNGALLYHATYIQPRWSRGKRPVARIGGHVFYK